MSRGLKLYIASVVPACMLALTIATMVYPPRPTIGISVGGLSSDTSVAIAAGVIFWVALTLMTSALPVQMPRGSQLAVSVTPIVAAIALGGPAVGGWVAMLGSTELRELRGRIPWYGTLANHAGIALPAVVAGLARESLAGGRSSLLSDFVSVMLAAAIFFALNAGLASVLVSLRTGQRPSVVLAGDLKGVGASFLALGPLAWLMAEMYGIAWWTTLLFALPLYTTRVSYHRFVEMREMFTQTIGALAEAVDKRDPFTAKHSQRVKQIAVDIGREMRVSESELEALEWGGLLHDVGKIGVEDAVLLKQDRLTREERIKMNAHPVLGAEIIAPVRKLAPELPIIRHHHEWYNGSGYPDRLIGDEIPRLARILHVADAFEAMTAQRPYRMTPLTADQAMAELRKFAGIQFDPVVVEAIARTDWAAGTSDPGRQAPPRPIPLIGQVAEQIQAARAGARAEARAAMPAAVKPPTVGIPPTLGVSSDPR